VGGINAENKLHSVASLHSGASSLLSANAADTDDNAMKKTLSARLQIAALEYTVYGAMELWNGVAMPGAAMTAVVLMAVGLHLRRRAG